MTDMLQLEFFRILNLESTSAVGTLQQSFASEAKEMFAAIWSWIKSWFVKVQPQAVIPSHAVSTATPPPGNPTAMYSMAARLALEEMLGYERYVLRASVNSFRLHLGKTGPVEIVINDQPPHLINLTIEDVAGSASGAQVVQELSPLVFSASYKLLDMVMEWTIRQNGLNCPQGFEAKIKVINTTPTLVFPDFLGSDAQMRSVVLALYRVLLPYRNAITHNVWGKNVSGDLQFNFHRKGQQYTRTIPFQDVLTFAEGMSLLGDLLVVGPPTDANKLLTIKWLLDLIDTLHGQAKFNILQPRYFRVVRRTTAPPAGPVQVDLDEVRNKVAFQAGNAPATYDLTVEAKSPDGMAVWKIGFPNVPTTKSLTLDQQWDTFRVSS
jgi:hypothetical protein